MIKLVTLLLQVGLPFINFFFARSAKKAQMKEKMFDLAKKYDEQVMKNAKLQKEYADLKRELMEKRQAEKV